jgi:hypothetical protein
MNKINTPKKILQEFATKILQSGVYTEDDKYKEVLIIDLKLLQSFIETAKQQIEKL